MNTVNRQWCIGPLEGAPSGLCLAEEQFVYAEKTIPEPAEGQMLIRATHFAPDPMVHAWARGVMPGLPGFAPMPQGSPLRGAVGGEVVASRLAGWPVGERVTGNLDWADFSLSDGKDHLGLPLERIGDGISTETALGTLGMNGLCAYFGLFDVGRPIPGDTVLVSGASGAIGSVAAQLAKLTGARVVGFAGGEKKCRMLLDLGIDAAIDYKQGDIGGQIGAACPKGVDVFFDNVGGAILDQVLLRIAKGGRIVVCGAMAHFAASPPTIGHHIMLAGRGATMGGFYYFDYLLRWPEARGRLTQFLLEGKIRELFDIECGFEKVPAAAISQFTGTAGGRKIIKISD